MVSAAKIAANRRNAQRSTGPRSIAGKARTRRNAFRHGLAVPIAYDIFSASVIEPLARALVEQDATAAEHEHAQLAAEAQAEILRVRRVRTDVLNRAAQHLLTAGIDVQTADELMAAAFLAELDRMLLFERYEERALSKRKWALRDMIAARRAEEMAKRNLLFFEPVEIVDIAAMIKAALVLAPEARYADRTGWRGEVHGVATDLRSDGLASAAAFVQCADAVSGRLSIQLDYEGHGTFTQTFAITKRSRTINGGRWMAICPVTGKVVAQLYLRKGERELKSRSAMNLHYRSRGADAARWRRAKRRHGRELSRHAAVAHYAAIVAAISAETKSAENQATRTDDPS